MRRMISLVLSAALVLQAAPLFAATRAVRGAGQGTATINGTALNTQNAALSGIKVQLRNVDTGQLAGSTTSASNGAYGFTGLNAGNYVVEIVDATGKIIGTSAAMSVAAGQAIAGVTVAASAAGALAGAAAAGGLGAFFTTTGGILVLAGVGAGITGAIVAVNKNNASPSR